MALGTPTLATPAVQGASSCTSGSFTPTAGSVLFACCGVRRATAPSAFSCGSSIGLTWNLLATQVNNDGGSPQIRAAVFWAAVPNVPAAMMVTTQSPGSGNSVQQIVEVTGAKLDFGNAAIARVASGDLTATLGAAPASDSIVLAYGCLERAVPIAVPSGLTELDDYQHTTTSLAGEVAYDLSSPGSSATWAALGAHGVGILFEIPLFTGGAFARATWR